jgi:hypothetical protein
MKSLCNKTANLMPLRGAESIREAPIYWRFPCGAGRPAIFSDPSR